jgi:hypothetical protein
MLRRAGCLGRKLQIVSGKVVLVFCCSRFLLDCDLGKLAQRDEAGGRVVGR